MLNFKKLITKETTEGRAEVLEEWLKVRKDKLKEFPLEGGVNELEKELAKNYPKTAWIELLKLQKLILEIRYLEGNGDATKECDSEKEAGDPHHIKGLVGTTKPAPPIFGTLDQKILIELGTRGEEYYLTRYFRMLAWDGNQADFNYAINKVKNGEDDLLKGIELSEKLGLYHKHFAARELILGPNNVDPVEKPWKKLIKKELDKVTPETDQVWRDKLKDVDPSLNNAALVNNTWKDAWTALGDKFKKADEVKALFNKVKDKADFLTELPTISGETGLSTLPAMFAKKPKEIIKYIETYWYNHLPDTDADEKKKEKTQMKRRIAKALNKTKESDLPDADIPENLVRIKTGELTNVDMTKFYNASLQEITTKKPEKKDNENNEEKPFFRLDNPWVYAIGALAIGIVGVIIFWDKLVNLFSGDKEETN